jgi:hypothetical protein
MDRDVMSEADISATHASTAYEAIERSRPRFLISNVDRGPTVPRLVYLNGVVLAGGVDELRAIPASSLREIRFVRSVDAATAHFGAGILAFSKVGR